MKRRQYYHRSPCPFSHFPDWTVPDLNVGLKRRTLRLMKIRDFRYVTETKKLKFEELIMEFSFISVGRARASTEHVHSRDRRPRHVDGIVRK